MASVKLNALNLNVTATKKKDITEEKAETKAKEITEEKVETKAKTETEAVANVKTITSDDIGVLLANRGIEIVDSKIVNSSKINENLACSSISIDEGKCICFIASLSPIRL